MVTPTLCRGYLEVCRTIWHTHSRFCTQDLVAKGNRLELLWQLLHRCKSNFELKGIAILFHYCSTLDLTYLPENKCSLFFIGPLVASKIPRCMAGTLLVHVGVDLFLEGTYDTYGKFERLGRYYFTSLSQTDNLRINI